MKLRLVMSNLYVLIGFDVEHDAEPFSYTCEGVKKGIPSILNVLDELDIYCTFNILANIIDDNLDVLMQIKKCGHEIGCHSYDHEALGFLSDEDIEWRVEKATQVIQKKFGERPVTFRGPYLLGNAFLTKTLEKYHYLLDSTYLIAHHKTQLLPYHPSEDDWTSKGNLNILELPVSSDPCIDNPEKSDFWPWWRIIGAKDTKRKINSLITKQNEHEKTNVITFYLHPWEFIDFEKTGVDLPDEQKKRISGGTGEKAIENFREIVGWLKKQKSASFITMKVFRTIWDEMN
jgi:peptidoglycan/xylan/chitin deacetylase (PgdA/CDA1 family)